MKYFSKKLVICVMLIFVFFHKEMCFPLSSFVLSSTSVKKKKMSKRELKEEIGSYSRDLLHVLIDGERTNGQLQVLVGNGLVSSLEESSRQKIVHLLSLLGNIQMVSADIQKHLSLIVEFLVEDKKPFKHARQASLEKAYQVLELSLSEVKPTLAHVAMDVDGIKKTEASELVALLVKQEEKVGKTLDVIKKACSDITTCESLKVS